jgi:hypothetical protein
MTAATLEESNAALRQAVTDRLNTTQPPERRFYGQDSIPTAAEVIERLPLRTSPPRRSVA